MNEPTREELFRRQLGAILIIKEDLEPQFDAAISLANTPDDFTKLTTAVAKTEKELEKIKEKITIRKVGCSDLRHVPTSNHLQENGFSHTTLNGPHASTSIVSMHGLLPPPVVGSASGQGIPATQTSLFNGHTARNASPPMQPNSGPLGVPEQERKSKVYRSQPDVVRQYDWRDSDVPDKQKIFIPHVSFKTTENGLGHFFQQFGKVVHVRIFSVPPKDPSVPVKGNLATVGFEDARTAADLIGKYLVLDNTRLSPREYIAREKYHVTLKKEKYQLFLGGIPSSSTPEEIGLGLQKHLCYDIRDIRLVYHPNQTGKQLYHRGFAYVDLESDEDAKYLLRHRFITISGKKAECKANTCSYQTITNAQNGVYPDDPADLEEDIVRDTLDEETATGHDVCSQTSALESLDEKRSYFPDRCIICQKNPRDTIFLWCCHDETCMACANKLSHCPKPECNEPIVMRQHKVKPQ